jgi:BirA family transcriptional regulator, biotin operon repressor / biotin---[acetyl-CoA-carboxylase] ligase
MIAFDIRFYDSLGSTQDEARRLARAGAQHGTVVTAREQTAGRGRQGRHWASPVGNLYLSILLRLELLPARVAELGFAAPLAVADVVDAFLPSGVTLKWPNDVLVGGAKISGILVEHAEDAAIVGIGLNVLHVPEGAPYPVTSLAALPRRADARRSLPQAGEVDAVRGLLLDAFAQRFDAWTSNGFSQTRAEWLRRAHPLGTKLHISTQAGAAEGRFAGIDDSGALLLDTAQGLHRLLVGDVSISV